MIFDVRFSKCEIRVLDLSIFEIRNSRTRLFIFCLACEFPTFDVFDFRFVICQRSKFEFRVYIFEFSNFEFAFSDVRISEFHVRISKFEFRIYMFRFVNFRNLMCSKLKLRFYIFRISKYEFRNRKNEHNKIKAFRNRNRNVEKQVFENSSSRLAMFCYSISKQQFEGRVFDILGIAFSNTPLTISMHLDAMIIISPGPGALSPGPGALAKAMT